VGILGQFAGGANSVCESAVEGMLTYMRENNDVWLGGLWCKFYPLLMFEEERVEANVIIRGGGPWWGSYIFSMEPPSGIEYEDV
jgi:endoglucanase